MKGLESLVGTWDQQSYRRDEPVPISLICTLDLLLGLGLGPLKGRDSRREARDSRREARDARRATGAVSELESWKGHHGHHKKERFLTNIQARALLLQARNVVTNVTNFAKVVQKAKKQTLFVFFNLKNNLYLNIILRLSKLFKFCIETRK